MEESVLHVGRSLRVPGLGLLVLPAAPVPAWLLAPALHTALRLRLCRPGLPATELLATIEELQEPHHPPTRALLLDADPAGPVATQAWLELLALPPAELY